MGLKAVNVRKAEGEFMLIPIDAQCMKRALINFVDNAGPDQPAHMRRECPGQSARRCTLIRTFAVGIWHKGIFPTLHI